MNSQRIIRHLVQITLMAGTMCLLPSVQAKSVTAVDAPTPMTAPSQNLKRDVDELLRGVNGRLTPDARPLLVAPGCGNGCRPRQNIGQAEPSMQRDESFDATPVLVAPGCPSCRPRQNIGQAQPSMQRDESFDPTPVLVAPDCGSVVCNWFRFFG